jgi:hypothetical protein
VPRQIHILRWELSALLQGSCRPTWIQETLQKGHTLALQLGGTFIVLEGANHGDILPNDRFVYVIDTDTLPE